MFVICIYDSYCTMGTVLFVCTCIYKYERKASYDVDKVYIEKRVGTYGSCKWHTLRKWNKSSLFSV